MTEVGISFREEAALEFRSVTFRYEGATRDALRDVSLRVLPGTVVVVTGESGCGKTTLTRMANGLIPLAYKGRQRGEVRVSSRTVGSWSTSGLARTVGSVFQNPRTQFVSADVLSEMVFECENLGMGRTEMEHRLAEATELFGIADLLGRSVDGLSGGQRQLVMLACAAMPDPELYVLDEPTASLDVPAMKCLARAVKRLKAAGKTVVISEHRLWWLADVADRIVVMHEGRIRLDCTLQEFADIPAARRRSWGLRALSVAEMADEIRGSEASPTGMRPILEAEALTVAYRRCPAVIRELGVSVGAGRAIALAGQNGAGKSTLARCMAGVMGERGGSVSVEGRPLRWRRRAGKVYLALQEPGYQLFSSTVWDELRSALGRRCPSDDEAAHRVGCMMTNLGLEGLEDMHPLALSGGQRQRLSIGAGLLSGARVLVLDEPTSGLDRTNMVRIASQLRSLKREGVGICVITHDFEFLCAVCDEVAWLDQGQIVEKVSIEQSNLAHLEALFGFNRTDQRERRDIARGDKACM